MATLNPRKNTGFGGSSGGSGGFGGSSGGTSSGFGGTAPATPVPTAPSAPQPALPTGDQLQLTRYTRENLPTKISFGQTALNALFTPLANVTGQIDANLESIGKIFSGQFDNLPDPVERGNQNVDKLWNGLQQPVTTFKDIWEDRLLPAAGIPDYQFTLDVNALKGVPVIGDMLKWAESDASKKVGAEISYADTARAGELSDYLGFAGDVAADPLTYLPLRVVTTPTKVAAKTGFAATKSLARSLKGEISLTRAAKNIGATVPDTVAKVTEVGGKINARPSNIAKIPANLRGMGGEADAMLADALQKVDNNFTYKTVISSNLGLKPTLKGAIVDSLEAGSKSLKAGIVTEAAKDFLLGYAKADIRGFFNPTAVVKFVRDKETGTVNLTTGNGVFIASAKDMAEAKSLAKQYRENGPIEQISGSTIANAEIQTAEEGGGITVARADGTELTLEPNRIYDEGDGTFTVWDGEDVRKFDSAEKAQQFIDIDISPAAEAAEVVVTKKGRNYIVTQGSLTRRFTSKARADEYAAGLRTGTQPARPSTPIVSGKLLLDSPAPRIETEDLLKYATGEETSVLRNVLGGLDKVARSVKGLASSTSSTVRDKIVRILNANRGVVDDFLKVLKDDTMQILERMGTAQLDVFEGLARLQRGTKQQQQLATIIKQQQLPNASPKATIGDAMASGDFATLNKRYGKNGEQVDIAVTEYVKQEFFDRAIALKAGKIVSASTPDGRYSQLKAAVGKEIADQIKETGYLSARNPGTTKKMRELLDNLSVNTEAISYQNYDDLVQGVARGDDVSLAALERIFKLIDPDRRLVSAVEKGAEETPKDFLRRILLDEGGVSTIRDFEKKLAMAGDPSYLMKAQGIGFGDMIGGMVRNMLEDGIDVSKASNAKEAAEKFALPSTRASALEYVQKEWSSYNDQVANAINRAFSGDAEKLGARGIFDELRKLEADPNSVTRITTLGDKAVLNVTEAYSDGSRAVLIDQLNQYLSLKVKGSLLGTTAARAESKAARLGPDYIGKTGSEKIDLLVQQMELSDNMLMAVMGTRLMVSKARKDSTFEAAFQRAVKEASENGGVVNFSASELKHTVFLHTGDVMQAIRLAGREESLIRAFFPDGAKIDYRKDVMSWLALDDAARRVLEMVDAGEPLNVTEIAARLLTRADVQPIPSAAKKKEFEQLAAELADALTDETALNYMKARHAEKATGVALSHVDQAQGFAKELFETLREGWRLNFVENEISEAARARLVRDYFRKFVFASGVMRAAGGELAETMFRAAAMIFTRNGKLLPESQLAKSITDNPAAKQLVDLLDFQELYEFRQHQAKWSRYVAPDSVAPAGREGLKKPTRKAQESAERAYTEAKIAYEKSFNEFQAMPADISPTAIQAWQRKHLRIQEKLDKARAVAWERWIETEHFDTRSGKWVPSSQYNRDAVLRSVEQDYNRYVAGTQGVADRAVYLADSAPATPPHKVLTPKQKAAWLKKFRSEAAEQQTAKATAINADAAANVLDELEAGAFDKFDWMLEPEKFHRGVQEMYGRSIAEQTQLPQARMLRTQYSKVFTRTPRNRVDFNRLHRQDLDELTPILPGDRVGVKLKELGERWYGPSGRRDLRQFYNTAESTSITRSSRFADALTGFRERWHRSSPTYRQDFATVFTAIRDGVELAPNVRPDLIDMHDELRSLVDVLRGELGGININSIDGLAFRKALDRFGLNEKNGFSGFDSLSPSELADSFLNDMPFGELPASLTNQTDMAVKWNRRKAQMESQGVDPLIAFAHAMEAVQMVKFEKGIAEGVASRFSAKGLGMTPQQAIAEGFVPVVGDRAENTILRFLPEDALFHPEIADQLGSVAREYNNLYNGGRMNGFARAMLEVTSFLKLTQTILRPGHHITNTVGDSSLAWLYGANSPTAHWNPAFRIAGRYTSNLQQADYDFFGLINNHAAKMQELERMFGRGEAAQLSEAMKAGKISPLDLESQGLTRLSIYKDGKLVPQDILDDDLMTRFEQAGILTQNAQSNDIMALDASFRLLDANEFERTFMDKAAAASRKAQQALAKVPGDFTAAYSNVTRIATAMRVMKSRGWTSVDDAVRAAADEVNKLHPTVQSLASTERKWGRLFFTYYTWMRVAQAAFIDMAVNHTAALALIPKAQYTAQSTQGYRPQSFGVPFVDKNALPSYYSYSVFGPNITGPQGPRAIRLPFMPLDVLDFWAISYDPALTPYDNVMSADFGGFGLAEGRNQVNVLLKTAAAITPGIRYDFDTGRASNIDTLAEVGDEILSNFGFTSLLTGAGLYTPQRYLNPDSTNQLTNEDRKRLLLNFFSGLRAVDYNRPVNLENAKREQTNRLKSINQQEAQKFVDKLKTTTNPATNQTYTDAEIYNILLRLGVQGD